MVRESTLHLNPNVGLFGGEGSQKLVMTCVDTNALREGRSRGTRLRGGDSTLDVENTNQPSPREFA